MKETTKLMNNYPSIKKLINGKVLDIGAGDDPVSDNCITFDKEDGDANNILKYIDDEFDVVFSSHCLEYLDNPEKAINDWYSLVKEDGYLIITVPDETLYYNGDWPSKKDKDHKYSFTIYTKEQNKHRIFIVDVINELIHKHGGDIIYLEIHDDNYDYEITEINQTNTDAMAQICIVIKKETNVIKNDMF